MKIVSSLVLMAAFFLTAATPASAADVRLGLSRDGVTFTPTLGQPLFDGAFRWVPGDVQTRTFFVRNQSSDPAELSIDVLAAQVDELIETGDLTVSARSGSDPFTDVSEGGEHRLVTWVPQSAGQVRQVDVKVAFDPTSTNQSQTRSLDLDLRVLLRQTGAGPTPTPEPPTEPDGDSAVSPSDAANGASDGILPNTGAPAFWTAFAGMAFVIAGLIVALSRREEEDSHV